METIIKSIREYLVYCKEQKKLSENTLRAYRIDTDQFIAYLKRRHLEAIPCCDLTKDDVQEYVKELIASYATRTCRRKIACIKAFFNYLEFDDIIPVNPFRKVRIKLSEPKDLPKTIRKQEISEQLRHVYSIAYQAKTRYNIFHSSRMVACYELLIGTGLRVGELCSLHADAIDLDNLTIRILGKGGKERIVYLTSQQLINALRRFLKVKQECHIDTSYFFTNWNGSRMNESTVRRMVRIVAATVLSKKVTPHMFRHTFATALLEKNIDICHIQMLLGHRSIKTTQIYLHLSNATIRTALMSAKLREQYG